MDVKFRNYCLIIMGETSGFLSEIIQIAETEPNILDANGVVIATFSSVAEPKELTDYFIGLERNFFIFDMDKENSGYHFIKKAINDGLFGFLKNQEGLNRKMDILIQEINSSAATTNSIQKTWKKRAVSEPTILIKDIDNMSSDDKNELMNRILKKDVKNLSEYDKQILNKLSN